MSIYSSHSPAPRCFSRAWSTVVREIFNHGPVLVLHNFVRRAPAHKVGNPIKAQVQDKIFFSFNSLNFHVNVFLYYLSSPNIGLTTGTYNQMPVVKMPLGGATNCGPQHLTNTQGCAFLHVWSTQCQAHRQKTQDRIQRTHTSPRTEIKIFHPAGKRTRAAGLEGRNSTDHATGRLTLMSILISIIIIIIIIYVFCPRTGPSVQTEEQRRNSAQRQVFHRKLRNPGCSFARDG